MKRGDILIARGNVRYADQPRTRRRRNHPAHRRCAGPLPAGGGYLRKLVNQPAAGGARFANLFDVKRSRSATCWRGRRITKGGAGVLPAGARGGGNGAAVAKRIVDWQIRVAGRDRAGPAIFWLTRRPTGLQPPHRPATISRTRSPAIKAPAAIEAAAVKDPENPEVKTRRAALSAKIEEQAAGCVKNDLQTLLEAALGEPGLIRTCC